MTQTGKVIGTPDYIAPEQARNSHLADGRADLYSLGCTFYCLLTGQVPFPNGTAFEKLSSSGGHANAGHESAPDVPPGVSAILNKLLAKNPADRFQTGGELAAALLARLQASKRSDRPGNGGGDAPHTTLVEGSRPQTAVVRGQTGDDQGRTRSEHRVEDGSGSVTSCPVVVRGGHCHAGRTDRGGRRRSLEPLAQSMASRERQRPEDTSSGR